MQSRWSEKLQCNWIKWQVESTHTLRVYLPMYNAPDMTGCIETAKALMPDVNSIEVFVHGQFDGRYRIRDGEWVSLRPTPETKPCSACGKPYEPGGYAHPSKCYHCAPVAVMKGARG